ncbi:class A beta-lactamase-related serine hydrolase [Aliifodinibius sp. S!AR15-10]|uniref:serine hydrolase n=1 Tax=Aliifodinibius sp. S!AR15-10 TaxID=2950437 RepID=UPI0028654837|nr:serine hydrolase [Aliifodinibius sp. S!AR15-10]MDR8390641.1 class A beta-lactamase-related serine hydrolase [Aliifodinibius sp. S!AR15-10]
MKRTLFLIFFAVHFVGITLNAGGQNIAQPGSNNTSLPFVLPDSAVKPLRTLVDEQLENRLMATITANKKWGQLVKQKKMALGLVDLGNINDIRFARINGNHMMYAASLPKISILLATMAAFEKGELEETEEIYADLNAMIAKSDNQASTRMIDRLSFEKIEAVMTDPKYEFYDEEYGGGLWVGKRYASAGRRYPDPIMGLSHAATASQVSRFYYLLAAGRLVSPERSRQMLEIMDDPALHHKFVSTLEKIAPKARLFRKSGTWRNYHSDSILVWGPTRRYILVALVNDPNGERIIRQLVMPVERVLNS